MYLQWHPWWGNTPGILHQRVAGWLAEVDQLMRRMMPRLMSPAVAWPFSGTGVRWEDTGSELIMRLPLPNADPERLEVRVAETTISIRAETRQEVRENRPDTVRMMSGWGTMAATFPLPVPVDGTRARVTYRDGVLSVHAPKLRPLPIDS